MRGRWIGVGGSRRAMVVAGAFVAVGLLSACEPGEYEATSGSTSSVSTAAPEAATYRFTPPAPAPGSSAPGVYVIDVIDGDTFEVSGGRTVRVLGIDSCEAGSDAGARATSEARSLLLDSPVTLRAEPGVDLDPYGRELRYVTTSSGDFGQEMVTSDHTAVYGGSNDAAPGYVALLRGLDEGRTCDDDPEPARDEDDDPVRTSSSSPSGSDDPAPRSSSSSSSGSSGSSGGSAYYKNCSAARAAGAAPLHVGDAGYRGALDRDNDGIACE